MEFNGKFKEHKVVAEFEYSSWSDSQYEPGGNELNPSSLKIGDVEKINDDGFMENFFSEKDGLYDFLCCHAQDQEFIYDCDCDEPECDPELEAEFLSYWKKEENSWEF